MAYPKLHALGSLDDFQTFIQECTRALLVRVFPMTEVGRERCTCS